MFKHKQKEISRYTNLTTGEKLSRACIEKAYSIVTKSDNFSKADAELVGLLLFDARKAFDCSFNLEVYYEDFKDEAAVKWSE